MVSSNSILVNESSYLDNIIRFHLSGASDLIAKGKVSQEVSARLEVPH